MYIYDYIIIGGGISGLYLTYKLMNSGKDILLLESSGRLGGRISTNDKKNFQGQLSYELEIYEKKIKIDSIYRNKNN